MYSYLFKDENLFSFVQWTLIVFFSKLFSVCIGTPKFHHHLITTGIIDLAKLLDVLQGTESKGDQVFREVIV